MEAGICNVQTDTCKFPTEEIINAHIFNCAPKFPQIGDSQYKYCIF